jgi:endonuclease YncB( thermonuclease family)
MAGEKMLETTPLTEKAYSQLVSSVRALLKDSDDAGKKADSGKAEAYWRIGDKLVSAGLTGKDHYGESVVERVASDLQIDERTLWRCVAFRRVYGSDILATPGQNVTWSHYRLLIEVHDDAAREYYRRRVIEEGWSCKRLRAAISGREYERVVLKEKQGPTILKRPTDAAFVYGAKLVRVIDGDTAIFQIDMGFHTWNVQRMRFAKLDAPELATKKGKDVTHFVRDLLEKARGLAVKTETTDDYGRYLGHIFYSFNEDDVGDVYANGVYLNEVLLEKKMAARW